MTADPDPRASSPEIGATASRRREFLAFAEEPGSIAMKHGRYRCLPLLVCIGSVIKLAPDRHEPRC